MSMSARTVRAAVMAAVVVCGYWVASSTTPQAAPDVDALMAQVSARVVDYYRRAQSAVWVESSIVQPIQRNWSPDGFARTVESEVRVEWYANVMLPGPTLIRSIRSINGRAPRDRDKNDRSGCTDPDAASRDPLAFLLANQRSDYRFLSVTEGKERGHPALVVDFRSVNRTSRPELIADPRGHADCFDWKGPVATSGRLWADANTFDVLRIDRHNEGPVDVRVPLKFQREYRLAPWVTIDRDDLTMRYQSVAFSDPDETIMLPESFSALTVLRSGLQSTRRTETYNNYRRFLTNGRIVKHN